MAVRQIERIVDRLRRSGVSPEMPTAVIESGTLPNQRVIVSNLDEIEQLSRKAGIKGPAIFVVGEVVRYRDELLNLTNTHVPLDDLMIDFPLKRISVAPLAGVTA